MSNKLERLHQDYGKWLEAHSTGPITQVTAVLIATATCVLEFPIWILVVLFVCPIAAIGGYKDLAMNIICMRHLRIFLNAAFFETKLIHDASPQFRQLDKSMNSNDDNREISNDIKQVVSMQSEDQCQQESANSLHSISDEVGNIVPDSNHDGQCQQKSANSLHPISDEAGSIVSDSNHDGQCQQESANFLHPISDEVGSIVSDSNHDGQGQRKSANSANSASNAADSNVHKGNREFQNQQENNHSLHPISNEVNGLIVGSNSMPSHLNESELPSTPGVKITFENSESSSEKAKLIDTAFNSIDKKMSLNFAEKKFLFPNLIKKFYVKLIEHARKVNNNQIPQKIGAARKCLLDDLSSVAKIAKLNKSTAVNESEITSVYIDIFNYYIKKINSQCKCKIKKLCCNGPVCCKLNAIDLKKTRLTDIINHIGINSTVTKCGLIHRIQTKRIINFVDNAIGCNIIKIIGIGNSSAVFEALSNEQNIVCIKQIFDNKLESENFCNSWLSSLYEESTIKEPKLLERTELASEIGELFAKATTKHDSSPTHSACSYFDTNSPNQYLVMSKCGDMPLFEFIKSDNKLTEVMVRSLIHGQFFGMIIGHVDLHYGNWLCDGEKVYVIDMGFTFPPFNIFATNLFREAIRIPLNYECYCSESEEKENKKRIKTFLKGIAKDRPGQKNIHDKDRLNELFRIRIEYIEDAIKEAKSPDLSSIEGIWKVLKEHREALRKSEMATAQKAIHVYTELPPLTKEIKEMYMHILEKCRKRLPGSMRDNHFTEKEISATKERVAELQKIVKNAKIMQGQYLDQENREIFSNPKTILNVVRARL
ncbi:MAG: hypothetical protein LBI69_01105 [Puniceicoccales bacterium]|jgi:hypothetical protein|nr:hypothetical protein [Puniceicoccales bacterium]